MWRPGRVLLSEIAADVIPAFRRGLTPEPSVRLELGPAVPDVHADSDQMRQAILSVLANAQEASVGAPAAIVVRTGIRYLDRAFLDAAPVGLELPEGDYAFLEVEDAGIGMDDVTRSRMFDPFFSTKFLGRGLGLAAVLGILRIHRGTVDVWTREGHGTRLTLFLPVVHQMGDI
jgi:signal transduction histidine kinase